MFGLRGASLRRFLVSLLTVLLVPLVVTSGTSSPAAATHAPATGDGTAIAALTSEPVLAAPRHGAQAIRQLADKVDEAAARNNMSASELRTLLRTDTTAWVDSNGHLFFVDPAVHRPGAIEAAPAKAAQVAPLPDTFLLHSNPGRPLTILLDFDGAVVSGTSWNSQKGVSTSPQPAWDPDGDGPAFNDHEKLMVQQVWAFVAEDYASFDVDVTTEDPGTAGLIRSSAADTTYGTRVLVTPSDDSWQKTCGQQCGGIAYTGVFDQINSTFLPAWVFPQGTTNNPKAVAEAAAHEAGHNLSLLHDGNASEGYDSGHGIWAPIMGVGYYRPLTQWSQGSYTDANNHQDDLHLIAGYLGVRPDEAPGSQATPVGLPAAKAVISAPGDVDSYLLGSCGPGTVVDVHPAEIGADLDVRAVLYDDTGTERSVSAPASGDGADPWTASGLGGSLTIPATGTGWVLTVDGVGEGDWTTNGYDDYGSLGAYTVTAPGCDGAVGAGTPSVPTTVSGATAGAGALTLSWDAPAAPGDGPVTGYVVSSSGSTGSEVLPADARSHRFTGLAAGTSYLLSVRAINATGGGPTATVTFKTVRVAPSSPRNVTGSYQPLTGALRLLWSEPALDGGAQITGYPIYLDGAPSGQFPATARGLEITANPPLSPGQHTIGIAAANAIGASPIVTTTITVPPPDTAAPQLSDFAFTPTSVNIYSGAKQVIVSARLTDQTGTQPPTVVVSSDSTAQTVTGGMDLASGTAVDGIWTRTVTIPGTAATGTWTVTIDPLSDVLDNSDGTSHAHPTKLTVTSTPPATVPGAPTGVAATAGNAQATVTWTSPVGDDAITGYTVTSSPGGVTKTVAGGQTSATVTGLTNGTPYTFTVKATNVVGDSPASDPSNPVTPVAPATAPNAPTGVTATAGDAQALVSWTAPSANGSPITNYTVVSSPGGVTKNVSGAQTSTTVTGLTNGTAYTFVVYASNAAGTSPGSAPSAAVTPLPPATAPNAPTGVLATAGNAQAFVSWTAPSANGSPITGYTVTALAGGVTVHTSAVPGGSTSLTMTGLSNGTTYTFTVVATNAVGDSPASAPSASATPAAPPGPDPACVAAQAHLVTANGTLTQAQKKLTAANKKLKAAQSAPLNVRAAKVKKAKAKVAAAKKKVKTAQGAVSAAQAAVAAAC